MSVSAAASKAATPAEMLIGSISTIVASFYEKTVHLISKRNEIEKGSEAERGYLRSVTEDYAPAREQLDRLASKINEKSMASFKKEHPALQEKMKQAAENLFVGNFCFELFDFFAGFEKISSSFEKDLQALESLKDNPFGTGDDLPKALIGYVTYVRTFLEKARTEAISHHFIFSDNQAECLESIRQSLLLMEKELVSRGYSLPTHRHEVFFHCLSILKLQRVFNAAVKEGEEPSRLEVIARSIGELDIVIRTKIQDHRPKDELIDTSSSLTEVEEAERLLLQQQIRSYQQGLERALADLEEYRPRRALLPFEVAD